MAIAVFNTKIQGEVLVSDCKHGVKIKAHFTKLPAGKHGFHIHKAGDLRGEGCMGLCEHYDIGHHVHGGPPNERPNQRPVERHTGDLGNIEVNQRKEYFIKGITVKDLWGRSIIVHADEDDLGKGGFEDSSITGHSGKRMGCAIFGRLNKKTKKKHKIGK